MLTVDAATESNVHDPRLRAPSTRVERLHRLLTKRMTQKQKSWGRGLTLLDKEDVSELPLAIRRALAFEKTLLEMPIDIEPDDLIVGNTVRDGVIYRTRLVEYNTEAEIARARAEGKLVHSGTSHKTTNYDDLMSKGLHGIVAEIDAKLAEVAQRAPSAEQQETLALFRAMKIECQAVIGLAARYARLAQEKAAASETEERQAELLQIAGVCRRVPAEPARTLHEAIQSFWFVNHAFSCTGSALSCGRIDQYLYPAYERDRAAGTLTLGWAQELIDCLWLRFCDRTQVKRENYVIQEAVGEPAAG